MTAAPCDTPDATLWHDLAALTTLIHLDLSGLCLCRCCSSSSSDTPTAPADKQQAAQGYGAAGGTAVTGLTGAPDTASSSSSGSGSMLAADGPEAQHGRELPQQGAASNPSSSTHPVWSWCGLLHGQSVRQPGRNSSRAAEGHTGGEPGAGAAESAGTTRSGIRVCEGPAPLQVLSGLTRLQQLVLADWRVPPTHAGVWGGDDGSGAVHACCLSINCVRREGAGGGTVARNDDLSTALVAMYTYGCVEG